METARKCMVHNELMNKYLLKKHELIVNSGLPFEQEIYLEYNNSVQ